MKYLTMFMLPHNNTTTCFVYSDRLFMENVFYFCLHVNIQNRHKPKANFNAVFFGCFDRLYFRYMLLFAEVPIVSHQFIIATNNLCSNLFTNWKCFFKCNIFKTGISPKHQSATSQKYQHKTSVDRPFREEILI